MWGVSLTHPVLPTFLCGEFLLHIICCLDFYAGSFSYTSRAGFLLLFLFCFLSGEFLLHIPWWFLFLSGELLLHIPCWLHFCRGSFSYIFLAGFIFIWGVSLTHPVLALILSGDLFLHIPCWLHFYKGSFSYTSVLDRFYVGSFSYTSHAAFIFMHGISLAHPKLPSILCGEFVLHIPCWLLFMRGISLTHPVLASSFFSFFFFFLFLFYVRSFFRLQSTLKTTP